MSAVKIANSGANLVSDRNVIFSKSGMCLGGLLWPLLVAGPLQCHHEASGGALVDAHHYQHTEVRNSFVHKVDAEVPI